jgi:hypothetical protein
VPPSFQVPASKWLPTEPPAAPPWPPQAPPPPQWPHPPSPAPQSPPPASSAVASAAFDFATNLACFFISFLIAAGAAFAAALAALRAVWLPPPEPAPQPPVLVSPLPQPLPPPPLSPAHLSSHTHRCWRMDPRRTAPPPPPRAAGRSGACAGPPRAASAAAGTCYHSSARCGTTRISCGARRACRRPHTCGAPSAVRRRPAPPKRRRAPGTSSPEARPSLRPPTLARRSVPRKKMRHIVALIGRLAPPLRRELVVPVQPHASGVALGELALRVRVPELGRRAEQRDRL